MRKQPSVVKYKNSAWYLDRRLSELRSIEKPNVIMPLSQGELDYFKVCVNNRVENCDSYTD